MNKNLFSFYQRKQVPIYHASASIYDHVMNHVDYQGWVDYIASIFQKYGNVCRVIDGGCGTGIMGHKLLERGFNVVGFDISLQMVKRAREKGNAALWQGDLSAIPLLEGWDAFLCLYDTIQYLSKKEIQHFFLEVEKILKPGALLIFDIVTENHVVKWWSNYMEKDHNNNLSWMRRSWYNQKERVLHTEIKVSSRLTRKIFYEHHCQYIFRLNDLKQWIPSKLFRFVGCFQDFTFEPGHEKSDRVHFVFRKESI